MKIGMMSFAHMHAASYARCLQQMAGVELVGIYDDNGARGQKMAATFGVPFFAEAQVLLDEGLDGVIICSENVKHRPMVELAAGQVAGILCEKPIATTLADAEAMIAACRAGGTELQIAYPVRFSPPVQQLKRLLDSGKLGKLYSAKCTNHGSMPGGWFVEAPLSGGGAVIDHTVHVMDLLWWFWRSEVVEVYAEVGDSLLHPGLGIDDAGMLSFRLANGVYGTLDTSWSRPPSYTTWGDVKIEVVGEKGVASVDAFSQGVAVSANSAGKTRAQGWGSDADWGLVNEFVGMIRDKRPSSVPGEDGIKSLAVALAAYESARTGRPIQIK
ncbi:MAG: Gfo/Idh/MocA family oxidoreductase [Anaerolineales bacterium]|nr:Gfo/Idh/MocA family oxidoreductase [Anaerolineales bacterium]